MLIHDISDVPLDFLRVFMTLKWEIFMVSCFFIEIVFYFRLDTYYLVCYIHSMYIVLLMYVYFKYITI